MQFITPLRPVFRWGGVVSPSVRNWSIHLYSTGGNIRPDRADEPARFIDSRASAWKAEFSRTGIEEYDDTPWYQGIVVSLSMAVFLLHFCVFREENDIDEELGKTLYDRIEGLEELQLRASLKNNLEKGLDTQAIEIRLQQIEQEKAGKE